MVAVATVMVGVLGMPSALAAGEPDGTFGDGGLTAFTIGGMSSGASAVARSGSGYVIGGFAQSDDSSRFALARILANGHLDTTFGGHDGQVLTDFFEFSQIADLAVLGSGKILAVGRAFKPNFDTVMAVARYRPNGLLDTTFSGDGKAVVGFGTNLADGRSLLTLSNGSFLVAGSVGPDIDHVQAAVAKFLPNGKLDTAFGGGDGLATVRPPGSSFSEANTVKAGGGGRILIGGTSFGELGATSNFLVARLLSDGRRDTSFSGDGIATKHQEKADFGNDLAVLPSGKILLAGSSTPEGFPPNVVILRFTEAGAFDTSFGVKEVDFGGSDQILDLSIDGLGRLVGAGTWENSMAVFRFSANGAPDFATFGVGGAVALEFPAPSNPSSQGSALLTPGAKILVVGSARTSTGEFGFAAARLLS